MKKLITITAVLLLVSVFSTSVVMAAKKEGSPPSGEHFNINCVTAWTPFSGEIVTVTDNTTTPPTITTTTTDDLATYGILPVTTGRLDGTGDYEGWEAYLAEINEREPAVIRDLLAFKSVDPIPLEEVEPFLSEEEADEILTLEDALGRLAAANPRAAEIVELRFFSGLTVAEIAQQKGVSGKTVQRDWITARAWLRKEVARDLGLSD